MRNGIRNSPNEMQCPVPSGSIMQLVLNQKTNDKKFIVYPGSQSSPLQDDSSTRSSWRAELRDAEAL